MPSDDGSNFSSDLTSEFTSLPTEATHDTVQNSAAPADSALETQAPPDEIPQQDDPVEEQPAEQPAETPAEQPAAPMVTAHAAQQQQFPVDVLRQIVAEANKPVNEFFVAAKQAQAENFRRQQEAVAQQQRAQQREQLQKMRETLRPRQPDLATATPESLMQYAAALSDYNARIVREDMEAQQSEWRAQVEGNYKQIQDQIQQENLRRQSEQVGNYIDQSVAAFAADPRYPFMKNDNARELFMSHWWSMNSAAGGKMLDPSVAMSSFVKSIAAFQQSAQTVQARQDQVTIDAKRKAEQVKGGVPSQAKPGSAPAKSNQKPQSPGQGDEWWNGPSFGVVN